MTNQNKAVRLTESAIMIALGTVLSILKLIDLPYGGSVTPAHMLPVVLIAYRYGTKWGLFTGAVYGLLQMLLGIKNLFAMNVLGVVAVLLLDYVIAYAALGLGGLFRRQKWSQSASLTTGMLAACAARYLCHAIAGATVWSEWAVSVDVITYSMVYNATYMIPETIVAVAAAAYIGSVLDFRGSSIARLQKENLTETQTLLHGLGKLALCVAAVVDVQGIFSRLQDAETGEFSVSQMADAPWGWMILVTVIAVLAAVLCFKAAKKQDLSVLSRGLWVGAAGGSLVVWADYALSTLTKAAEKSDLAAPLSSLSAFFAAFPSLGVKYGVPLLVSAAAVVLLCVLAIKRARQK